MTTARPILFSAPMIRALLDSCKTQTRRIMKPQPSERAVSCQPLAGNTWSTFAEDRKLSEVQRCPYGKPGDLLWVRETWQVRGFAFGKPISETRIAAPSAFHYRATDDGAWKPYWGVWRPSIFMPRWASRITLEITDIRVERLQEIKETDAIAEGLVQSAQFPDRYMTPAGDYAVPVVAYQRLWESINGATSWNANPWVWVLTFRVHKSNLDTFIASRSEAA